MLMEEGGAVLFFEILILDSLRIDKRAAHVPVMSRYYRISRACKWAGCVVNTRPTLPVLDDYSFWNQPYPVKEVATFHTEEKTPIRSLTISFAKAQFMGSKKDHFRRWSGKDLEAATANRPTVIRKQTKRQPVKINIKSQFSFPALPHREKCEEEAKLEFTELGNPLQETHTCKYSIPSDDVPTLAEPPTSLNLEIVPVQAVVEEVVPPKKKSKPKKKKQNQGHRISTCHPKKITEGGKPKRNRIPRPPKKAAILLPHDVGGVKLNHDCLCCLGCCSCCPGKEKGPCFQHLPTVKRSSRADR